MSGGITRFLIWANPRTHFVSEAGSERLLTSTAHTYWAPTPWRVPRESTDYWGTVHPQTKRRGVAVERAQSSALVPGLPLLNYRMLGQPDTGQRCARAASAK